MSRFSGKGKVAVPALVVVTIAGAVGIPMAVSQLSQTYCTDANNTVVDDTRCDNTNSLYGYGNGYYLHHGYYWGSYGVGRPLPQPLFGSDNRVESSNTTARTASGYSGSGRVASGKSGGFGSGKGGSGGSGSSGSHGGGSGGSGGSAGG